MTDPTFYVPLAKAAEAAGYHAMTIADSVAYPFESDAKYPYTPDGSREFLDGKAIIESFVLAAALCAVTTTLRFNFFVLGCRSGRRRWLPAGRIAGSTVRQQARPRCSAPARGRRITN